MYHSSDTLNLVKRIRDGKLKKNLEKEERDTLKYQYQCLQKSCNVYVYASRDIKTDEIVLRNHIERDGVKIYDCDEDFSDPHAKKKKRDIIL